MTTAVETRRPGRYPVEGVRGLHIWVKPDGRRYWIFRVQVKGQRKNFSLGSCDKVTQAEAESKAEAKRREVSDSPVAMAPPVVYASNGESITLGEAAEQYIKVWQKGKSAAGVRDTRSLVGTYLMPELGGRRLQDIRRRDIIDVLVPLMAEKPGIAGRARSFLDRVYKWAIARELVEYSPADGAIKAALPEASETEHHSSVPYRRIKGVVSDIATAGTYSLETRAGLVWLILSATRLSETAGIKWDDVDVVRKVWTTPKGSRGRKGGPDHRVPLTRQMMDILDVMGPPKSGKPIMCTRGALQGFSVRQLPGYTLHGFRTTFRTWAQDHSDNWAAGEIALSHKVGDQAAQAYARSDMLEVRRDLMQDWADYTGFDIEMLR